MDPSYCRNNCDFGTYYPGYPRLSFYVPHTYNIPPFDNGMHRNNAGYNEFVRLQFNPNPHFYGPRPPVHFVSNGYMPQHVREVKPRVETYVEPRIKPQVMQILPRVIPQDVPKSSNNIVNNNIVAEAKIVKQENGLWVNPAIYNDNQTIQSSFPVSRLSRRFEDEISPPSTTSDETPLDIVKEKTSGHHQAKSTKKKHTTQWKPPKKSFTHQYLATNLMGHTGKILGMDCSSDGKYLVTCAEDEPPPDPDDTGSLSGSSASVCSSSSGSEGGKDSTSPTDSPAGSSPGSPTGPRRSARRRRKPKPARDLRPRLLSPEPLSRYADLNLSEADLAGLLSFYLLPSDQLAGLGYPVEDAQHPTRALIYAIDFSPPALFNKFDVNAREFVPKDLRGDDSGRGSGSSSPRSADSDPESEDDRMKPAVERRCARCTKGFFLSANTERYLTTERCRHHWGKLRRSETGSPPTWAWSCCSGPSGSPGCSRAPLHVWSGTCAGMNGPLKGFVRTRPRSTGTLKRRVLALDCEMCYTASGLQVAQLEVVGADGCRVYSTYVLPDIPVIDYNTRFSGISAQDMKNATKSLKDVQRDLLDLVDAETILVGHGLENDLRALRVLHGRVVDTAVSFPHARGLPFRKSLRTLTEQHLARPVQESHHCPLEDARASLELMLWKINRDFRLSETRPEISKKC